METQLDVLMKPYRIRCTRERAQPLRTRCRGLSGLEVSVKETYG